MDTLGQSLVDIAVRSSRQADKQIAAFEANLFHRENLCLLKKRPDVLNVIK